MIEIGKFIDYTFLKPTGDKDAVRKLCREAKKAGYASVCVNPGEVKLAAKLLKKSEVKVCTVIDFPLGQGALPIRCAGAVYAIEDGAEELDLVVNQRLLKYDSEACFDDLKAFIGMVEMTAAKHGREHVVTKLILECCNLTKNEIVLGCKLAKKAGFDFVKTSTGFGIGGATVEDVKLMRKTVGKAMGVKAAGGIRDRETAEAMLEAGATRLGMSTKILPRMVVRG